MKLCGCLESSTSDHQMSFKTAYPSVVITIKMHNLLDSLVTTQSKAQSLQGLLF